MKLKKKISWVIWIGQRAIYTTSPVSDIPPWVGNPFPTLGVNSPRVCELPPWVGNPFPTPLDTPCV